MDASSGILRYARDELLSIWDAQSDAQEEWRAQFLTDLGPEVVEELRELETVPDDGRFRRRNNNRERRLRTKAKRDALHALSTNELASNEESENFLEDSCDLGGLSLNEKSNGREYAGKGVRKSRVRYDDDDSEIESFQPQAFAVEGEPDFESGPPQDGWEYLRRVKHEAALCPKVVVAEIDPKKLTSVQTPYMPEVPAMPVCSPDLLPCEAWEKQILADFSVLRTALSNIRVPRKVGSAGIPSLRNRAAWEACCFATVPSEQSEDSKEPDPAADERLPTKSGKDIEIEAERASVPFGDPPQSSSGFLAGESKVEPLDSDKDPAIAFNELLERQLDQLLNTAGSTEESYVIDFSLLSASTGVETEFSFDAAEYLISGDLVDDDHEALNFRNADDGVQDSGSEDDGAARVEPLVSHDSKDADFGSSRDCTSGIENQFEHLKVGEAEDAVNGGEPRISTIDSVNCEESQPITAEFMDSLGGHTDLSNQMDLICGSDTHFEFPDTGNPEILDSDMEVMLPSSYADFPDFEDVQMLTADLVDSAVGLEVYRSSNILDDDAESASQGGDFEIDPAIDVLFAKIFQLVGLSRLPFMHLLLRLDEVSRATLLRHHVAWLEHVDGLPQDRAVWLLALASVIDAPVDAQTSAALRVLLRYCAGVRGAMQEKGDEDYLYRLNVLITVAGLYFGQAEVVKSVQS